MVDNMINGCLVDEIERTLLCWGLKIGRVQATYLAIVYQRYRPHMRLTLVVELLLNAPVLVWAPHHTLPLKVAVMDSLVQHLDGMYFVDTFEHDCAANPS
jgi:hypothetical protein